MAMTIQAAPDDCTGCGICVDVCPAKSKEEVRHKSINMEPMLEHLERERDNFAFFLELPEMDRTKVRPETVKGSQMLGDRILVANATGCSSIYGGNLPTTPWSRNADGRGPAWSNSLFEDNAEFGFGMRLALDQQAEQARALLRTLSSPLGQDPAPEVPAP